MRSYSKRAFLGPAVLAVASCTLCNAQTRLHAAPNYATSNPDWWKNAVIYQIYPRSFQDSDADGIGDLRGITARLDYLQYLGVDAIWLSPIYPSPQADFGYDVSNYEDIDPQFGTLSDFDHLIAEANKRHIRVLMDMVMNHTSDEHEWFMEARSSRDNPYRDWYVWRNGKGETETDRGLPPTNWKSEFGHSAWQWDEKTRQYYYHKFHIKQPDLNWNNPKVHEAFRQILRFWLDRGVAGFRFDAITSLFEDPSWTDESTVLNAMGDPVIDFDGEPMLHSTKTDNLPGVHAVMQEMRATSGSYSSTIFPGTRLLLGETYLPNIDELAKQYGSAEAPEFQLPMDTQVAFIDRMDVAAFRARLIEVETKIGDNIPMLFFDNHDNPRLDRRYGDGVHDLEVQRALAATLLLSRGAALVYYGDEIGMTTTPPNRKEEVKDPVGIAGWPKEKGRDGERTPMQWDDSANAGFSRPGVKTWLPVAPDYSKTNVQAERSSSDSLLKWYRALIQLKRRHPALTHGENTMLDTRNEKVLSWERHARGAPTVVISVNFTADRQFLSLDIPESKSRLITLLKSPGERDPISLHSLELAPFGVFVGEIH
jgi:alpha-glucosidase